MKTKLKKVQTIMKMFISSEFYLEMKVTKILKLIDRIKTKNICFN
jgi:hypothetical protein